MHNYFYHLLVFFISILVVFITTPLVKEMGLKTGLVDPPDRRKIHKRPMVRLGGISIFISTYVALLIIWGLGGFGILSPDKQYEVVALTLGSTIFFLIGLADDILCLSPFIRLVMQISVAIAVWIFGVQIEFITIPFMGLTHIGLLSLPITVIWLVGVVNAINWIDGLDGLAAGVSGIATTMMVIVCLFMNQSAAALIAAALAGATLGFLRYNFNPAQIFMGDGGSYFIGFTVAGVGVIGLVKTTATVAVILPYLILAVPILDMSAVIISRVYDGKSPFFADRRHLHHRLLQAGLSHKLAVWFIYALTLWFGSLALAFAGIPSGFAYAVTATSLLSYAGWQVWKSTRTL